MGAATGGSNGGAGGGWAAPGAAAEQPVPAPIEAGPPGAPARGRVVDRADGDAGDAADTVPAIALRPMTVADILDGGFAIVKARPAPHPRPDRGVRRADPPRGGTAPARRTPGHEPRRVPQRRPHRDQRAGHRRGARLPVRGLCDRDHRPRHRARVHCRRHRPPRRAVGHGARRPCGRDGRGHRSAVVAAARLVRRGEAGRGGQRARLLHRPAVRDAPVRGGGARDRRRGGRGHERRPAVGPPRAHPLLPGDGHRPAHGGGGDAARAPRCPHCRR